MVCHARENITDDFFEQGYVAWKADSTGLVHIVWDQVMGTIVIGTKTYPIHYLYYRNFDPITHVLSTQVQLGSTSGHWGSTMPDIGIDSNDTAHIVWTSSPVTTESRPVMEKRKIMYTTRNSSGVWLTQPEQISGFWGDENGPASQCRWPDVEIDSSGRPHVIWSGRPSEEQAHVICDVFYNYKSNGQWKYNDPVTGHHGFNVTNAASTGLFSVFLVQQPRFEIGSDDYIYLVYRANIPQSGSNPIHTAYYATHEILSGYWPDPIGCEISEDYTHKRESDIELKFDNGVFRPYIVYSNEVSEVYYSNDTLAFTEINLRMSYMDGQGVWHDQNLFQSTSQYSLMDHFPCFCMDNQNVYVSIKVTPVLQPPILPGDVSHINKILGSVYGFPIQLEDVDDTAGEGYTSCLGWIDDELAIIYRDTVSTMLGLKPNLFFYSE
ncbi:hypothetical protein JW823_08040 [bacterium]|nr:hypothetical protein [candidate division CSSED10-310 bacterium]